MPLNKPSQIEIFEHKFKKLLADQRFCRWVMVEQKDWIYALPKNYQEEPQEHGKKIVGQARQTWLLKRQY